MKSVSFQKSSQSTSCGKKCNIPQERDPRYIRPVYTYLDNSNDSILIGEDNETSNNKDSLTNEYLQANTTCPKCNKMFKSTGLRTQMTRMHSGFHIKNEDNCSIVSYSDNEELNFLERAYDVPKSSPVDENGIWYKRWKKICVLRGKQYDLPNGNIPKQFVHLLADEVELLAKNTYPSERLLVFLATLLQRDKMIKQAKDIRV